VVEQSTYDPKFEGSNPIGASTGREKITKRRKEAGRLESQLKKR
jgi:hypothetical protein